MSTVGLKESPPLCALFRADGTCKASIRVAVSVNHKSYIDELKQIPFMCREKTGKGGPMNVCKR